jgi:hypothetical protein
MMDVLEIITKVKDAACTLSQMMQDNSKFTRELIGKVTPISNEYMAAMSIATAKIASQDTEIRYLKERLASLESKAPSNETMDVCDTLTELTERNTRSRNILLFNVPEVESNETGHSQNEDDTARTTELIHSVETFANIPIHKVQRLGMKQKNKIRPVKVILGHSEDARTILFNKFKLPKEIRVKQDLTQLQRSQLKSKWDELEIRKKKGEGDLAVRFVNGAPKIVKINKKN